MVDQLTIVSQTKDHHHGLPRLRPGGYAGQAFVPQRQRRSSIMHKFIYIRLLSYPPWGLRHWGSPGWWVCL